MGQLIAVTEKPSSNPGVVRFETNRILTGMGHERYRLGDEVWGDRPPDELARRLFAHGTVDGVHVNGNMVTVDLSKGRTPEGLKEIIERLYWYYDDERTAEFQAVEAAKAEAARIDAEKAEKAEAAEQAKAAEAKATEDPAVVQESPAVADSSLPEEPPVEPAAEG